jgi:hypothetical protein
MTSLYGRLKQPDGLLISWEEAQVVLGALKSVPRKTGPERELERVIIEAIEVHKRSRWKSRS